MIFDIENVLRSDARFAERTVSVEDTLLSALKKMDSIDNKLLIVSEDDKIVGFLSAGDIQRALIDTIPLDSLIKTILRDDYRVATTDDSSEAIEKMMLNYKMEFCPVVDSNQKIIDIVYWEDVFGSMPIGPAQKFNLPIVIMAGGLGTRLKPFTNVLPKPLMPFHGKTIIENIFQRFGNHGSSKFIISLNYKAELIEFYIRDLNLPYTIECVVEDNPLGTAGSLSLIRDKISTTFFVSNCDILINEDYSEMLNYHTSSQNAITIIAAIKHVPVQYGVVETGKNGKLVEMVEKPELTFKVNSGLYILEPEILDLVKANEFQNMTDLIERANQKGVRVGVFPVPENAWQDIGTWREFLGGDVFPPVNSAIDN